MPIINSYRNMVHVALLRLIHGDTSNPHLCRLKKVNSLFRLEGAKRDNDFIYHETEPPSTALPEIKGIVIIKIFE